MKKPKHDVKKLPKWAQALIADLRDQICEDAKMWTASHGVPCRIVDLSTTHLDNIINGGYGSTAQRSNVASELCRRSKI